MKRWYTWPGELSIAALASLEGCWSVIQRSWLVVECFHIDNTDIVDTFKGSEARFACHFDVPFKSRAIQYLLSITRARWIIRMRIILTAARIRERYCAWWLLSRICIYTRVTTLLVVHWSQILVALVVRCCHGGRAERCNNQTIVNWLAEGGGEYIIITHSIL